MFRRSKLAAVVRAFAQQEDGPTAVEYAVMLALIVIALFTVITNLGTLMSGVFNAATEHVTLSD